MTSFTFGATLTLDAKYGKTGGLAGNLNQVGDTINGRNVCNAVNTNANGTPGCDMSDDSGLNDNGTPNNLDDDYYEGDMIVRTNDSFEAIAAYSWNGVAGGAEEEVTITGTLPVGKGFIWDGIPGSCKLPDSTLSADKKTIVCVKKDFDTNNVGSFAEDLAFAVKVEGDAVNGSKPGYVAFTIDTPNNNNQPITDTTQTDNPNDDDLIVVTASPRWNIDKHGGSGYYTTSYGVTNPDTNEKGYMLWYNFIVEVDEVPGEDDNVSVPALGNEALLGGADATVTFTDDLSQISPNAVLATWSDTGCDMAHSNSDEPYATPNATYPDRSVSAPNGPLAITCTQAGTDVSVTVEHIDGTLTNAPTKTMNGGLLTVKRKIAAIGTIKVFVPLSDVEKGANGVDDGGNGDDGELLVKNCITDFTPKGISNNANFNGLEESEADNCREFTLYASRGSWSKRYTKGWGDTATQQAQWGGGSWYAPPTDASFIMAGDGTANPGTLWGTYNYYGNAGGTAIENPMICDVIDIETFEMVILDTVDDPDTAVDDTIHAVDINHGYTETLPGITVQYAIGYVGTWPPDPDVAPGYKVAEECNATSITWYDDYAQAKAAADAAGTAVSKARMFADEIPPAQYMSMRIKHKARTNYFTSGNPIPNKTLLVNYAVYKSALTSDKYSYNSYRPHDADQGHEGGYNGDRLIMQRAKVRILKDMEPTNVSPGSEVAVTLTPSFSVDGTVQQTGEVKIVDLLPNGLNYKNGSTVGSYDGGTTFGEPTVYAPATDAECNTYAAALVASGKPCGTLNGGTGKESILLWDLGMQTTGVDYGDLNFTAIVPIDAPPGTLSNYTQIESPADDSAPAKRIANANVNNTVPTSLLIVKKVFTPLHEINKGSLLNWMEFNVGVRNGSADALSELDIIDILPFNGDGVLGSFKFTPSSGTTVDRDRDPATHFSGIFQFDSMSFDDNGECDATNISYWYTQTTGTKDISPVHSSNTDNAGNPTASWCEGTVSGPDAGCGFTNADVTAVRVRGIGMQASGTCYLNLKYATQDNVDEDIYSNTASAKAKEVTNAVLSNTVSAKVYASSIGDKVWFDANRDGVQANDATEPGIDNVTVNLYDGAGALVATTTTAGGGLYSFPNLVSGDYVVEVVPPAGYLVTDKSQGGNTAEDSDIDTTSHKTDTITLGTDQDRTDIDAGVYTPVISGNVFQDGDGDADVDASTGTISAPDGVQLHATLLDSNGVAIATTPIAADGSYSFGAADGVRANTNYSVVLATTANATASDLPANWNNTGENINSAGAGNDGTDNGLIAVSVATADVPQVDFGINKKPVAQDKTEPSQLNPGGTIQVQVPDLNVTDEEDGTPTTITIKTLPTNGTLYYDGTPVTAGQVIPNFDSNKLTVDPDDGNQIITFDYTTTDADNIESDPATVTMPFTNLLISGNVFSDNDGDNNVNGTAIHNSSGTQLHATLLDENGAVLATIPIQADGTYAFGNADGIMQNTNYSVVLATTPNATTSDLPIGWKNTGENINSAGAGNDGTADGTIAVSVGTVSIPQIDFGIIPPVQIGDKVWIEDDNDGDATTGTITPVVGAVVTATSTTTSEVFTATTDANGNYSIAVAANDTYVVTISTPTGTSPAQGSDDSSIPDTTTENDKTHNGAGTTVAVSIVDNLSVDFGFVKTGSITGNVSADTNNDNTGDKNIANVTLELYDNNGVKVATTKTDANGNYSFNDLIPGNYTIREVQPGGYLNVSENEGGADNDTPNDGVINSIKAVVTPGETDSGNDFVEKQNLGKITGNVSAKDAAGHLTPISNVTLVLFNTAGQEVARTTTDGNGNYIFEVVPGSYYIQEQQPRNYYNVSENEGGADNEANNPLINTINVIVGINEVDVKNDFIESHKSNHPTCGCAPTQICALCAQTASSITDNTATLQWKHVSNVTSYEIYVNGVYIATVGASVTSYELKGLQTGTDYAIQIVSVNSGGNKVVQKFNFKTTDSFGWLPAIYNIIL